MMLVATIEETEALLYAVESEMNQLQIQMEKDAPSTSPEENPWQVLFQQCQQISLGLDEIRGCLDHSSLNTQPLLAELQFLSDNEEMKAFRLVRDYCTDAGRTMET